jgi:tripartite-type tricarboxylate transporter receptor subunit TctC
MVRCGSEARNRAQTDARLVSGRRLCQRKWPGRTGKGDRVKQPRPVAHHVNRRGLVLGALAAGTLAGKGARAQSTASLAWPSQPIRLVVPFAPGGTTDLVARLVAQGLQEALGQPMVAENRPGAGATVGSQAVASAAPDGHTLVMSNIASHAISPHVYRNVRYNPVTDFTHAALVTTNPSVMVANPNFPVRSLTDYVALAKARPGGLDFATSGAGSSNHLLGVRLALSSGATLNHIPYRGAGPAMTDVIAGVVPVMFDSLPSASAHIRAGSVRALGVSSAERSPAFPDVPTFKEQGFDVVSLSWFGLSGPAGMAPAIVERINAETRRLLARAEIRARFDAFGGTAGDMTAAEFAAFVQAEYEVWGPVVRASGATAG